MSDFSHVSSMKDSNSALRTVLKLFLCVVCKLSMVLIKNASVYTHSLKASQTFWYSTAVCGTYH